MSAVTWLDLCVVWLAHFGHTNVTRSVEMKNPHGCGGTVIVRDIDASSNTLRAHIVTSKIVV